MPRWIGLLRGINVGGHHKLPMATLREDLESLGLTNVRTYIQSGNVVFDGPGKGVKAVAGKIVDLIDERHGFRPVMLVIKPGELDAAIRENPFQGEDQEQATHFYFLETKATAPKLEKLEATKSATEKYELRDNVFYLYAPDGLGRSKLAEVVERALGVTATARNYRTVTTLQGMVNEG